MSLLGKVLPMTIGDTGQNEEIKSIEMRVVYPLWWWDEEKKKTQMAHRREAP
jgi:hypothetical protein